MAKYRVMFFISPDGGVVLSSNINHWLELNPQATPINISYNDHCKAILLYKEEQDNK